MAITLTEVQLEVLNILQKSPTYQGFYTVDKVTRAVNESLAYVSARMMMQGNGWRQKIGYVTTTAGALSYALPADVSIINKVSYKSGDIYYPMTYMDESTASSQTVGQAGMPGHYRLLGSALVFPMVPSEVGVNYLQIEYTAYPDLLVSGADIVTPEIDRGLYYYLVYRSCGLLVGQAATAQPEWQLYEMQWFHVMESIISKRLRVYQVIGEYGGG